MLIGDLIHSLKAFSNKCQANERLGNPKSSKTLMKSTVEVQPKNNLMSFHFTLDAKIWDTTDRKENAKPNVQCWVQLSLKPMSLSVRLTNIYEYLSTIHLSIYLSINLSIICSIYPNLSRFEEHRRISFFLLPIQNHRRMQVTGAFPSLQWPRQVAPQDWPIPR